MFTLTRRTLGIAATATALVVSVAACGGGASTPADGKPAAANTVQITDNVGTQAVPSPPQRVVVTDNHYFRTLADWGITPVAAPKGIMAREVGYFGDDKVLDLGNHQEPDLERVVTANPDLVINGYRFAKQYEPIKKLVPKVAVIDLSPVKDKPLAEELKRGITTLGQIFAKPDAAATLIAAFDQATADAKKAYNGTDTVLGVLTSGGDISYVAPSTGRSIGPVFDMLGLKPALSAKAGDTSHGDDISVEAIAQANPQWLIVMDRDAAVKSAAGSAEYKPAKNLIENNPALKNVPAVQQKQIVYLAPNFYQTEDIQAYTELLNDIAKAFATTS